MLPSKMPEAELSKCLDTVHSLLPTGSKKQPLAELVGRILAHRWPQRISTDEQESCAERSWSDSS